MLTRRLGRTGHHSSVAVLGGAAFWGTDPEVTATAFTTALDAGVNHLDVAPATAGPRSLLGPLVAPVRDRLFVACKTMRHDPVGVRAQLEESLTLLRCDSLRPLPDARRDRSGRARRPGPSARRHHGGTRRGSVSVRRASPATT